MTKKNTARLLLASIAAAAGLLVTACDDHGNGMMNHAAPAAISNAGSTAAQFN